MLRSAVQSRLLIPCLIVVPLMSWGGLSRRWVGDDGFINVRVAEQILAGNGFVFNLGERVEAVTSPLWLAMLTLAGALGAPVPGAAVALGIALSVFALVLAMAAVSMTERDERLTLPVGALVYACVPAAWDYASSGLEGSLSIAWIGASLWTTTRGAGLDPRELWRSAWMLGLGPLVRPDLGLIFVALGGLFLFWTRSSGIRTLASTAASLIGPAATYQIFRMGYFGALVPNTALAKEAFEARWEQGLHYLTNTFSLYNLWVPLSVATALLSITARTHLRAGRGREAAALTVMFAAGVAHIVYVMRVGGDFMHARMLLPGLFAVLAPIAVVQPRRLVGVEARVVAAITMPLVAWCIWCAGFARVAHENEEGIGDEAGWHRRQAQQDHPIAPEQYERFFFHASARKLRARITRACPPYRADPECERIVLLDPIDGRLSDGRMELPLATGDLPNALIGVVARRPLGIASAVLGGQVGLIDHYGLADPVASRLEVGRRGRPGHEKQFSSAWIAARFAAPGASSDSQFLAAQRALRCGDLAEIVAAARAPMTLARFAHNFMNAYRLHQVRIPRDARAAERLFCAGETPG